VDRFSVANFELTTARWIWCGCPRRLGGSAYRSLLKEIDIKELAWSGNMQSQTWIQRQDGKQGSNSH